MEILTAAGTMAVVAAVLFLAWWCTRKLAGGSAYRGQSRYMKVIDRVAVAQDRSIILIQTGQKIYMAGVASSEITLLAEIEEDDLVPITGQTESPFQDVSFKELIQKVGGKKKNG
ncbi:flagellar biosynthetic protein FliO [Mediterraneibacter sp. NSJ-55]|uniref:Flagellar protein n=1 Tax=Mediterraneibacter hominis TaxID=2763054 RepID=A0A923LJZ2_9FIRM|nr:flagellar biosynthetic protein FliO [Mediterraneibacter hominis]MBC5689349.1 flagellar biosynthetic protein FliO [Mediterraneibacter hominis]